MERGGGWLDLGVAVLISKSDTFSFIEWLWRAAPKPFNKGDHVQAELDAKACELVAAFSDSTYLLIGRQNDPDGIFSKFWFDLKLPDSWLSQCFFYNSNVAIDRFPGVLLEQLAAKQLGRLRIDTLSTL